MPTGIIDPFRRGLSDAEGRSAQRPFVVVDLDGCLIDDVAERFGSMLRKVKSRFGKAVENWFEEGTFYSMIGLSLLLRSSIARRNTDLNLPFVGYVVDTLKALAGHGYEIVVRSSNPAVHGLMADTIKTRLEAAGIHAIVEYKPLMHKADPINGERPSLLLDDLGAEGLPASRHGVPTVVRKPGYHDYQLITDKTLPIISRLVHVADERSFKEAALSAVAGSKRSKALA